MQLLIVLLLIYSVLSLQVHGSTSAGKHYILLIDNSASMAVADPARAGWNGQGGSASARSRPHRGRHGHGNRL